MMAFNALGCFSAGFYYVRINSALSQEFDTVQFTCFFFKNTDKFGADDFPFCFRISYSGQFREETFAGINIDKISFQFISENSDDAFRLIFTHQAMVNMHAGPLRADSFDQKCCYNRRIDTAGQSQQNFFIADLFFDQFDLIIDEIFHIPVSCGMALIKNKFFEHFQHSCMFRPGRQIFYFSQSMADRHYRHAKLINGCFHVDRLTVDNIVFSPVDDDTFNIRQLFQFCCCDIMGFDLAVNTQFPYGTSHHCVFVAAQI